MNPEQPEQQMPAKPSEALPAELKDASFREPLKFFIGNPGFSNLVGYSLPLKISDGTLKLGANISFGSRSSTTGSLVEPIISSTKNARFDMFPGRHNSSHMSFEIVEWNLENGNLGNSSFHPTIGVEWRAGDLDSVATEAVPWGLSRAIECGVGIGFSKGLCDLGFAEDENAGWFYNLQSKFLLHVSLTLELPYDQFDQDSDDIKKARDDFANIYSAALAALNEDIAKTSLSDGRHPNQGQVVAIYHMNPMPPALKALKEGISILVQAGVKDLVSGLPKDTGDLTVDTSFVPKNRFEFLLGRELS